MRKIDKGKDPKKWTQYRLTSGVGYASISELREALLKEQGYICAYCMRKIPQKDKYVNEDSHVEHIRSRHKYPASALSYRNMVICCSGAINEDFHCDRLKADDDITFNLFDDHFIDTLSYSSKDGKIESTNAVYQTEIEDFLNLNHALLKLNRKKVLTGLIQCMNKSGWNKSVIQKQLDVWSCKNTKEELNPYCGVVIWYLKNKLKVI